jgi:DNA-binding Xre family transcriptional regulator
MPVSYKKLFEIMKQQNLNKYYLRKNGIHAAVVDKLIKDKTIDTTTITRLCELLKVQPGDIMEYIPDVKVGE